ncbi:type II toxin-antitoxin system PemK/MazF family toxin [Rickettsia helvetica]|uniref:Type II toxin-antitoxin system PemK/MazF family toxin n=1 Tax=Rickettsia helvetica TaxID=35789 RepID=A0ABP0T3T8_RICHE
MEIIEIKKGYIIACVISGDYGKPRPAVVVQSHLHKNHPSITVCPLTTDLIGAPTFRPLLTPTELNGLNLESHIMVDKISAIRSDKIQKKIDELSPEQLEELIEAIKSWMN